MLKKNNEVMITYSIIPKSQLESAHRLDAEYYQPEYLEMEKKFAVLDKIRASRRRGIFSAEIQKTGIKNYEL